VNCLLQDRRGFIWIGTDDGLNRYDGKNFVTFQNDPSDSNSISGNIITAIMEDKDHSLWISTADGGLSNYNYRLEPKKQFTQYRNYPDRPHSLPVNIINDMIDDDKGNLWLGTAGKSIIRFNKKDKTFHQPHPRGIRTILTLEKNRDGWIWAGRQGGGLIQVNPATNEVREDARYKDLYAKLPHVAVTSLYCDSRGNMWFGSWDKLLYKFNVSDQKEYALSGSNSNFKEDELTSFAEDRQGRLWMGGTTRGLQVLDTSTGKFINYRFDPSVEGSLSDDHINCIFIDKQKRIWIGTNKGISITDPSKQQFTQQFLEPIKNSSLTVCHFFENTGREIWIGTSDGIYIYKNGSLVHKPVIYKGQRLAVTCILKDGNDFYIGTDYSVFTLNPVSFQVALLPKTEKDGVMKKLIDSRVVSMLKTNVEGRPVLFALPYGHFLVMYDLTEKRWISRLDSSAKIVSAFNLTDNLIRKITRTRDDRIWLATAKSGLGLWNGLGSPSFSYFQNDPSRSKTISNNYITDIAEAGDHSLWVSTYGGGLHLFDTRSKEFNRIEGSNNLVEGLNIDMHQKVWMVSNGNVYCYDPARKSHGAYHLPDLEKTGGVKGQVFQCSDGKIFVAGRNYFIRFHPDSISIPINTSKVEFTDFLVFNKSKSNELWKEKIKLKYNDNYFTIEFSSPGFSEGINTRYSYQLLGFDEDWVDAANRNHVSYSNLPGGDYEFRVRATLPTGEWSDEISNIKITIVPPFWKQTWFFISVITLVTLLGYASYKYRVNEILKRQSIRNRIAQDLHDSVGSTLSSISVYSQVARIYQKQHKENDLENTLDKISTASSEMISELNDTVWAINPQNDSMQVILQRMESFAKPLVATQGMNFHLESDKQVSSLNLEMEKRKNLYLVFKEAVNNALKYSGAKNLFVKCSLHHSVFEMMIKDDGKGFDLSQTSEGYKSSDAFGGGNGLKNMQRRASEMKGSVSLTSSAGNGTTVILKFPLT